MRNLFPRNTALAAFSLSAALVIGACAPAATDKGNEGGGTGGKVSTGTGGSGSGSGGSGGSGSGTGGSGSGSGTGGSGTSSGTGGSGSGSGTGGSGSGTGGSGSGSGTGGSGSGSGTGGSGGGAPDAGGTADTGGGSGAPTFTKIYTEVLSTTCAGAACHTGGAPKDGVDFNDKMKAFMSATAKKTDLLSRIKSTNAAQRMPKGKPALSADVIKMFDDWYAAGGKND